MKVNISLVFLGAVAASAIALPAQAATVVNKTTVPAYSINPPNPPGTVALSAYSVEGVVAGGNTYNVDFAFNTRTNLYGNPSIEYGSFADTIGNQILLALNTDLPKVAQLIDNDAPDQGRNTPTRFYIPKLNTRLNSANQNERTVLVCVLGEASCTDTYPDKNQNDALMYAKFSAATTPAPGTNGVPTPALIPGLLGMGLAAMRKKQQAA
jgi:hypothetical protein